MAKRIAREVINHYLELRLGGTPQKEARSIAGLGHVRADYEEYALCCLLELPGYEPVQPTGEAVAQARSEGRSWGNIAACAGMPESRARKLYTEHTSKPTAGTRVGKGGRFVKGAEHLYTGARKETGFKYNKDGSLPKK